MDLDFLHRFIIRQNPWWVGEALASSMPTKRELHSQALDHLDDKFIISITGPRRVGKTTLIYQLIEGCLHRGVGKDRIFYISFDELITGDSAEIIEDILEVYRSRILKEKWRTLKEVVYIFLDEIQYVPHWQAVLKRFYDLNYRIKFIVTGSASAEIQKGKESLAGRIFNLQLLYLNFGEYLKMKGVDYGFPFLVKEEGLLEDVYHKAMLYEKDIKGDFFQYLLGGGFPELLEIKGQRNKQDYVYNSVIEKVVFKDIPQAMGVRDSRLLMDILLFAASNCGQLFETLQLSKNLKVSRETVSNYIEYLMKAFLIDVVSLYSPSVIKRARTSKKIYVRDTGIISAMLRYTEDEIWRPEIAGKIVETYFLNLYRNNYGNVSFWRDPYGHEVDIVVGSGKQVLAMEIKYRAAVGRKEIKGLLYFMEKYGLIKGYVITQDTFRKEDIQDKTIFFVPAYLAATVQFATPEC